MEAEREREREEMSQENNHSGGKITVCGHYKKWRAK